MFNVTIIISQVEKSLKRRKDSTSNSYMQTYLFSCTKIQDSQDKLSSNPQVRNFSVHTISPSRQTIYLGFDAMWKAQGMKQQFLHLCETHVHTCLRCRFGIDIDRWDQAKYSNTPDRHNLLCFHGTHG